MYFTGSSPIVPMKIPKQASAAAIAACPRCDTTTNTSPSKAARKISRAPNIGATFASTGARLIRQMIEMMAPMKLAV